MMKAFIEDFYALCVMPPQLSQILPKDLTAYLPAKQLLHETQYDSSPQGSFLHEKTNKLLHLLETRPNQNSFRHKSPIRTTPHHECRLAKIDLRHNQNIDNTNKQIKKQSTISELSKIQYRIPTETQLTPQRKTKHESSYEEYQMRRVSPKIERPKKISPQKELLNSKVLFEQERQIYTQLLQLQNQLSTLNTPKPTKSHVELQPTPTQQTNRAKTVRLNLTPNKKTSKIPQIKDKSEKKYKDKEQRKTRLLTDRIEKTIRS